MKEIKDFTGGDLKYLQLVWSEFNRCLFGEFEGKMDRKCTIRASPNMNGIWIKQFKMLSCYRKTRNTQSESEGWNDWTNRSKVMQIPFFLPSFMSYFVQFHDFFHFGLFSFTLVSFLSVELLSLLTFRLISFTCFIFSFPFAFWRFIHFISVKFRFLPIRSILSVCVIFFPFVHLDL
jgi:hypothetical protein